MSGRQKRREPLAGGSSAQCRHNDTAKIPTGRPEFQENGGNARNASQRPPTWPRPAGADALDLLARLWGRRC